MSVGKYVNITGLITTYNLQIKQLPDNLKCVHCKLVLNDAYQVPCGCRFCRTCIDDMMEKGNEFCPGVSDDCVESPLSCLTVDNIANRKVCLLTVTCPHNGCVHQCSLDYMEQHMRKCLKKSEECPYRELGCTQDKLVAEEMGGHLQNENRIHSEILIMMIVNINKEIETLKQKDEASSREIQTLKQELVLRDEQIRSIMDQMIHVQNENESIKNEIKSIKAEKENLAGRVRTLSEEIEREIAERRENDELDSTRVIDHVDREIVEVMRLIGSNEDHICIMKSQMQSIQDKVNVDASCEWLIIDNMDDKTWNWEDRQSEYFSGAVYPYKYRLKSVNSAVTADDVLYISLFIHDGLCDERLPWPFEAKVVITVADKDKREVCRSISLQCQIERPPDDGFTFNKVFVFRHCELRQAGLRLNSGVRDCPRWWSVMS